MGKIVRVLGAIVWSLLMYSVPIIVTLSFAYDWSESLQFTCGVAAIGQFGVLVLTVLAKAEEDE